VQEILHVCVRRGRREEAIALAHGVIKLFPNLLPVTPAGAAVTCGLLARYPRLSVRDAVHAATMLQNGITQIASLDPDFDAVAEIKRLDPGAV